MFELLRQQAAPLLRVERNSDTPGGHDSVVEGDVLRGVTHQESDSRSAARVSAGKRPLCSIDGAGELAIGPDGVACRERRRSGCSAHCGLQSCDDGRERFPVSRYHNARVRVSRVAPCAISCLIILPKLQHVASF